MRRQTMTYLAAGLAIALGTVALGWWMGESAFVTSVRWQIAAVIMLAVELVFLLFIPAKKGGQQFGLHGSPSASPLISSGADFSDAFPARRLEDWRWLIAGAPNLVVGVVLLIML